MSRLRELRKERGFTQVKMQMLTGIDQSAYSKIERGERYLSFEQCRRVALALNTSMDYLAGRREEALSPQRVMTKEHPRHFEVPRVLFYSF